MGDHFDVIVIGTGPAGHKAAIQAAKAGRRVLVVEKERAIGGSCVHHGTIPSKTLRETAQYFRGLRARGLRIDLDEEVKIRGLMTRLRDVLSAHDEFLAGQLDRNGVQREHGRGRFVSPREIEVQKVRGESPRFTADVIVLAPGSTPRTPPQVPVDHQSILDSDSILSINYLPRTLTVLGGGVIASEYASIFAALGVAVTMIDKWPRPLGFLSEDLTERFVESFESNPGCRFLGERQLLSVRWDGVSQVETELEDGTVFHSEKLLCALGRVARLDDLNLEAAGLSATDRGLLEVDADCRTAVPHIYAVGDVIGPPALASAAMEQGRRAMRHALCMPADDVAERIPSGIYTIPEISIIGLSEKQAVEAHGAAVTGIAHFGELARGQIACSTDGFLRLIADGSGRRLLGAEVFGEGATELVHVAQMALANSCDVDVFIENIFNFPTLGEAYRVAAIDIARKRDSLPAPTGSPESVL